MQNEEPVIPQMNPEVKAEWLAALRSGEYSQGHQRLRTEDNQHCCLGVLSDLAVKAGVAKWELGSSGWAVVPPDQSYESAKPEAFGHGLLPKFIRDWSGLTTDNGTYCKNEKLGSLTYDNDHGDSFEEIANTIEECL